MLLGNLFRDQLDRYGELETIADRWAGVVAAPAGRDDARAQRRRPAGRRPRARPTRAGRARRVSTSASTTTRSRCPSSSTRRTPSTAAAAATPTSTSAVYLAHLGHYRCPNCGQERPEPDGRGHRRRAARHPQRRVHARAAASARRAPAARASTTSTTRSRAAALTLALGVALDDVVGGLEAVAPAFGRAETLDLGGRTTSHPAGQEPGRRQRGAADARARGRRARPLRRAQRPHRRRPRRLAGSGTPTGSCSSPRVRRFTCSGTRAAELALRMKYAGVDAGAPARRRRRSSAGLDAALADGDGPLYVVPTYTALLELRDLLDPRAARRRRTGDERPDARRLARRRVRRATTPTWRCGASWRAGAEHGVLDVGAGTGPRRAAARRAPATTSRRSTSTPSCSTRCASAPPRRASTSRRSPPTPRDFALAAPVRPDRRADADDPAAAASATASSPPPARALAPGGRVAIAIADRARALRRRARRCPRPTSAQADGWTLHLPADRDPRRRRRRCGSSACARRVAPDGERVTTDDDVIALAIVTPGALAEEAARARPRGRGAAPHPRDRPSTSPPRWWSSVADRPARLRALSRT